MRRMSRLLVIRISLLSLVVLFGFFSISAAGGLPAKAVQAVRSGSASIAGQMYDWTVPAHAILYEYDEADESDGAYLFYIEETGSYWREGFQVRKLPIEIIQMEIIQMDQLNAAVQFPETVENPAMLRIVERPMKSLRDKQKVTFKRSGL